MSIRALDAVAAATASVDSDDSRPRARFVYRASGSEKDWIAADLAPLGAIVALLHEAVPDTWVIELPDRVFIGEAESFDAAYTIQRDYSLDAVEPDLPTNFFPVIDGPAGQKDPAPEGVSGLCFTPEDPALTERWALGTNATGIEDAWAYSVACGKPDRGQGIVIAQPDTGILPDHPEMQGIGRTHPRDVIDDDVDPTDPLEPVGNPGHGTGTGSVALSPGTRAMSGAAPRAIHMPIRAVKSVVRITQGSVAEAIHWAVDHGAHVITMSIGGIPSFALHDAVRRAVQENLIVLAAAGNCVRTVVWPARYVDCIAVAGINYYDAPWKGSCRGSAVDFSAPAENVFRARVGSPDVGQGQGTSFAVALSAGIAALWLAHHGRDVVVAAAQARHETVQTMFRRLAMATARRPLGGWEPAEFGTGIVNARALLDASFDLNLWLESVVQPESADARATVSVEALVLETVGPAALAADVDWKKFGPEVATAILRRRVVAMAAGGPEESRAFAPSLSRHFISEGGPLAASLAGGRDE